MSATISCDIEEKKNQACSWKISLKCRFALFLTLRFWLQIFSCIWKFVKLTSPLSGGIIYLQSLRFFLTITIKSYFVNILTSSCFYQSSKIEHMVNLSNLACSLRYHGSLCLQILIYWTVESFNPYLFTFYYLLYNLQYFLHNCLHPWKYL